VLFEKESPASACFHHHAGDEKPLKRRNSRHYHRAQNSHLQNSHLIGCCPGGTLEDWLVDEFLVLGLVPFQNWMLLAIAIAAFSIAVSAWWVRD